MTGATRRWLREAGLLTLLLFGTSMPAPAQDQPPGPVQWRILSEAPSYQEGDRSPRRYVLRGAAIGAAVGTAFGLAVIAMADCGSGCTGERVVGVVGHAAAGAVIGGLLGRAVYAIRR